jgi:hypothetical protein
MTTAAESPAEELEEAIEAGRPVARGNGEPAEEGQDWGNDRTLPAPVLYELLARPDGGTMPRAAILVGLRISGRLNLHAVQLKAPLIFHGCYFDEPVNLMAATAVEIRLTGCHLSVLAADQLITRGDLDLSMSTLKIVSLPGAHIGGQFVLNGTKLTSDSYPPDLGDGTLHPRQSRQFASTYAEVALMADGLRVDEGMFCRNGFEAQGEVRLPGAHIGGQLSFNKATLRQGLSAFGLKVDRDMFCRNGFEAQGEVNLRRAHIAGALEFDNATLGQGLSANSLHVGMGMYCQNGFEAQEVNLQNAHIAGQLSFEKATLRQGLTAYGLRVDGDMFCRNGFEARGQIRLLGAHIAGQLSFDNATLGQRLLAESLQVGASMYCRNGFEAQGEVNLRRAHIAGALEFDNATLRQGLSARLLHVGMTMYCRNGFEAQGEVNLQSAHIGDLLSFDNATLRQGLSAFGLKVDRDMFCRNGFEAQGEVNLQSAHIAGQLSFEKATLRQGLTAYGLRVDGDMFCRNGFEARGQIRLLGAHIAGQLSFDNATLGQRLLAESLQVGASMYCRNGFEAQGEVNLRRAHIAGALEFDNATLRQGLSAFGLKVDRNMYCRNGFEAQGEVNLQSAHIAGQLSFSEAKPIILSERALILDGARVDDDLVLCFTERCEGEISLADARVGRLLDSESTWPKRLRLGGFEYDAVRTTEDRNQEGWRMRRNRPAVEQRLRWIRLAEESQNDGSGASGYVPQPYMQLIAFYQREGRDGDARRVAYERECRHRNQHGLPRKAWNTLLRFTVGYGYRPLRALAVLGVLVLVGILAFSSLHAEGDIYAIKGNHPPFVAGIYTLDRLIPVVTFGLRDAFASKGLAQWLAFAYTLFGWVLTIAVIAGLNAAVWRK